MSERWRPNFDAEFKKHIQKFLDRHEEIPFTDPREFTEAIVKNKIMDIEAESLSQKDIDEHIKNQLDLD